MASRESRLSLFTQAHVIVLASLMHWLTRHKQASKRSIGQARALFPVQPVNKLTIACHRANWRLDAVIILGSIIMSLAGLSQDVVCHRRASFEVGLVCRRNGCCRLSVAPLCQESELDREWLLLEWELNSRAVSRGARQSDSVAPLDLVDKSGSLSRHSSASQVSVLAELRQHKSSSRAATVPPQDRPAPQSSHD